MGVESGGLRLGLFSITLGWGRGVVVGLKLP